MKKKVIRIYNVSYNGCDLCYIGETKGNLEIHLKEHSHYVINQEISKSSVAKLSCHSGHIFNFQTAKIIINANSTSELNFLENVAIYLNCEVIVNDKSDTLKLSLAWKNLFSTAL